MSYFKVDDSIPLNSSFLSFSHPPMTIYNSDRLVKLAGPLSALPYLQTDVPKDNASRLSYYENGRPALYKPKTLYVYSLLHKNISDLTTDEADKDKSFVGEVIIEYTSSTVSNSLYLCILLKKSTSSMNSTTSIDQLITMLNSNKKNQDKYINSVDLNFDIDLPRDQKCLLYKDKGNTVIILVNPIIISSGDTSSIISGYDNTTTLFNVSAPADYITTTINSEQEEDYYGNEVNTSAKKDDIYIDCNPVGEDNIADATSYNIPLGTSISRDLQKTDLMKTILNFFTFAIGAIVVYVCVPLTYKSLVIDKISALTSSKEVRLRSADILISVAFLITFITLLSKGLANRDDFQLAYYAIFVVCFYALSFLIIQLKKVGWMDEAGIPVQSTNFKDPFTLIGECLLYAYGFNGQIYKEDKLDLGNGATLYIIVSLIIAVIFTLVFMVKNDKKFEDLFPPISGFILIVVPLVVYGTS